VYNIRTKEKTQFNVKYNDNDTPQRIDTIVISSQHDEKVSHEKIKSDIKKEVIDFIIPEELVDENTRIIINQTGRFVIGGPHGDAGLTGRIIIVDTYGGYARHGGVAFIYEDVTKVTLSAAYVARYIAKYIGASGLSTHCEIQLS